MLTWSGLLPARFLTIVSHLAILVSLLLARENNVKACLPLEYSEDQYKNKDLELVTGLGLALGLVGLELFGFLSGLSMFKPAVALLSIAAHSSASVALAYFVVDIWDCNSYWWVFAFCSALPALVEVFVMVGALLRRV